MAFSRVQGMLVISLSLSVALLALIPPEYLRHALSTLGFPMDDVDEAPTAPCPYLRNKGEGGNPLLDPSSLPPGHRRVHLPSSAAATTPTPTSPPPSTILFTNATFWLGDIDQPGATASCILAREGRVAAHGLTAAACAALAPADRTVDLLGAFVLPGLIDPHIHLISAGEELGETLF
jgi:hypothetical protein